MERMGCIIVSYNVPGIISEAVNSIRDYVDRVLIIDNSDKNNPAYREADGLGVLVKHTGKNIGHGKGMDMGIRMMDTEYVVVMDSDTVVEDGAIVEEMLSLMDDNVYGVGKVIRRAGVDYLHPAFAMIRKRAYLKHDPFIHHGAPCCKAMASIAGKMRVINIKNRKIKHRGRMTRGRNKK